MGILFPSTSGLAPGIQELSFLTLQDFYFYCFFLFTKLHVFCFPSGRAFRDA